ncbi:MAG: protein kinase [Planctomycetota bacterium]
MSSCVNCGQQVEGAHRFCPGCGTRSPDLSASADQLEGRTLNKKYRVLSRIGSGSMGTVYLAEHIGLQKKVALKILHSSLQINEDSLHRFQREGIAAGQFSHPNAIQIFDFDQADGQTFYLAMEYVQGESLQSFLSRNSPLPPKEAVDLARQILGVLAEAHRHGIVHRDLKPENIMVTEGTLGERSIKVLDFGLSKLVNRPLQSLQTQTGMILGTPMYMSPEQCAGGEVDHRSDLYSLALILFELLSGELPFKGRMVSEILIERTTAPARPLLESVAGLDIPRDLDQILRRALESRPEDRYQSARDLLDALSAVQFDLCERTIKRSDDTARTVVLPSRRKARSGSRMAWAGLPLLLLLGIALISWKLDWFSLGGPAARPARLSSIAEEDRSDAENRYVDSVRAARDALRSHDAVAALMAAQVALSMSCRDAEGYVVRGLAYRQRQDMDTALADFRAALEISAGDVEAAAGMGWVHLDRGEPELARAAFETALSHDANYAWALAGLGGVRIELGDLEPARELLQRAIESDPELAAARYQMGRLRLLMDDREGAVETLVEAKRNDPRHAPTFTALGEAYLRMGRLDQAEAQLRQALQFDAKDLDALSKLAAIEVERGRFSEADALLELPLAARPEDGSLHFLNGIILEAAGKIPEAIAALKRGVRYDARSAGAEALLGVLLRDAGNVAEAEVRYRNALELDDGQALPHLYLGLLLVKQGEYRQAADHLETAAELDPEDPISQRCLGLLYLDYLGDRDKAVQHLRRYRELGGADEQLSDWLSRARG